MRTLRVVGKALHRVPSWGFFAVIVAFVPATFLLTGAARFATLALIATGACVALVALRADRADRRGPAASSDPLARLVPFQTLEACLREEIARGACDYALLYVEPRNRDVAGDVSRVVQTIAWAITGTCRSRDITCHLGDLRFTVLVRDTPPVVAPHVVARIHRALAAISVGDGTHAPVDVVIGLATGQRNATPAVLLDRALRSARRPRSNPPGIIRASARVGLAPAPCTKPRDASRGRFDVHETPTLMPVPAPAPPVSGELTKPPLVLVAEDDADARTMYAELLAQLGYRVLVAGDGIEALELGLSAQPDLFVMDIAMPGMDGCEVTRRLRADRRTAKTPILAVTAFSKEWETPVREAGCTELMSKPTLPEQFESVVQRMLPGCGAPSSHALG